MSIAELIMQGTNRASESTAWVGNSLAELGRNVSAALEKKEQQKQAQEMLPFLQQSMQESMTLAQTGDTAAAYSNMMGILASNPNLMQNQAVLPFLQMGLKGINESAERYKQTQDYNQRQAYYDKVTANKTGKGGGGDNTFTERFNQARGRGGSPIVEVPLPEEPDFYQETDIPQGGVPAMQGGTSQGFAFGAGAYQPSEQTLQQFAKYSDQYDSAKPKQKKALEAQRTIVYDNQDAVGQDISNLDNDQFGFTQVVAGAADPTLFGIQYARFKQGDINAKGEPTYKANNDAEASIGKLQEALNLVNDRPELKDIYTKAGGWKNIELKPTAAKKADDQDVFGASAKFEVINKKNPNEKVEVTQDEFTLLGSISKMIPTSQTNDMKIIRVGEEKEPSAEAPAPAQGGAKKLSLEEIASGKAATTVVSTSKQPPQELSADNPFAQAVSQKQTQEAATTKQSLETQKTKIQDSILELENKLKILTAVGQRNPEILPNYLRRKMSAYMNATPSRNAKDFEDTKKEIKKLRTELDSVREKILESSK